MNKTDEKVILIVDDEEAIITLLETILGVFNYKSIACIDPAEALEIAKAQKPDLVILDIAMPEIDGYQVCRQLKQCEQTSSIPVLMVTALALIQDKKKGIESGADGFIFKPFDPQVVIGEIEKLVHKA
jgi:DNA-binding response OmpR family regulator